MSPNAAFIEVPAEACRSPGGPLHPFRIGRVRQGVVHTPAHNDRHFQETTWSSIAAG
jgi:hypothetical protein